MKRLILSFLAIGDIDVIWDYTADRWGIDQAQKYTGDIRDACYALCAMKMRARMQEKYALDTANIEADRISSSIAVYQARSRSSVYCISRWITDRICSDIKCDCLQDKEGKCGRLTGARRSDEPDAIGDLWADDTVILSRNGKRNQQFGARKTAIQASAAGLG